MKRPVRSCNRVSSHTTSADDTRASTIAEYSNFCRALSTFYIHWSVFPEFLKVVKSDLNDFTGSALLYIDMIIILCQHC